MADSRLLFFKGGAIGYQSCPVTFYQHAFSTHRKRLNSCSPFCNWKMSLPSAVSPRYDRLSFMPSDRSKGLYWQSSCFGLSVHTHRCRKSFRKRFQTYAELDVASAIDVINDLGFDTLTFLVVTVMVVPVFKILKASPILGFFCAGVVLNQFGLIRNLTDVKVLSEWGILFLLFEMGLELSLARLRALAKFAFGMGLTQAVDALRKWLLPIQDRCRLSSLDSGNF